ncbi:MAG TPA: protein kinase [Chitinophagales bacterium]|nr:protein kinase [Chitinophagales bacterium]HRG29148.1 protein kinase [Chitinophagales bacterium]
MFGAKTLAVIFMDGYKAKKIEETLKGKDFLGYEIINLINNGKSAAVFKAKDNSGNEFAIKIFDNELIERFGHEIQESRIEKEISLKGHTILNLIKIIDGGKSQIDADEYYYIIMEYIDGLNLKEFIIEKNYDNTIIQKVVQTIFTITEELLLKGIVHRDIKPENIMISKANEIILMDLGVLKLIGVPSQSDQDEKQFVGTLRYAPPEFLLRTEEDSLNGWKAVNLYQIGGLMHDLITKKELFHDYNPYSKLVLAIKEDAPIISNETLPFSTIQLSRDLLIKDWNKRLAVNSNKRILDFCSFNPDGISSIDKEFEDILSMTSSHKTKFEEIEKITRSNQEKNERKKQISESIDKIIDECFQKIKTIGLIHRIEKSKLFFFDTDREMRQKQAVKNYVYKLESDISKGFPRPMFILVKFSNDENSFAEISLLAMFLSVFVKINMDEPPLIFKEIGKELTPYHQRNQQTFFNFKTYQAFNGTVGFDEQFKNNITLELIKLIKVALKGVETEVKAELEQRENFAKGEQRTTVTYGTPKTKLFHSLE